MKNTKTKQSTMQNANTGCNNDYNHKQIDRSTELLRKPNYAAKSQGNRK